MRAFLFLTLTVFCGVTQAAQNTVFDITQGNGLVFTPGNSLIRGSCSFSWGGLKVYPIEEFFQGATSYEWDTTIVGINTRCVNIATDVADNKVIVPFVDSTQFQNRISVSSVAFASSNLIGTFFTVAESEFEFNTTYISAGTRGTANYFYCELPTDSLELEWLQFTGLEKQITPGWILSMTWFGSEKRCARMTMSFDPSLLKPKEPELPPPLQCNVGCVPK